MRALSAGIVIIGILLPQASFGQQMTCTNSYQGRIQKRSFTLPAGTQYAGRNQMAEVVRGDDVAGSKADIGKTFYTPELTTFTDRQCSRGPCNHSVPGTAHRSWPIGACVAICNLQNKECAIAVVMDRGPNVALGCRAIDGNVALKTKLKLTGITPATYQLISLKGPCDTGGPISIPTPDPARSSVVSGGFVGQPSGGGLLGGPSTANQPIYRQPADFSNYHSSSPTNPSPYFSGNPAQTQPQSPSTPSLVSSPVFQSNSVADTLLTLLQSPATTSRFSPFKLTVSTSTEQLVSGGQTDTVLITPLRPAAQPAQTFSSPTYMPRPQTVDPVASILESIRSLLQRIREALLR